MAHSFEFQEKYRFGTEQQIYFFSFFTFILYFNYIYKFCFFCILIFKMPSVFDCSKCMDEYARPVGKKCKLSTSNESFSSVDKVAAPSWPSSNISEQILKPIGQSTSSTHSDQEMVSIWQLTWLRMWSPQ